MAGSLIDLAKYRFKCCNVLINKMLKSNCKELNYLRDIWKSI